MGNGGQLVRLCLCAAAGVLVLLVLLVLELVRLCLCAAAGAAGAPQHTPWRLVWTWHTRVCTCGTGANSGASSAWC